MATEPVNERPIFPQLLRGDANAVGAWSTSMIRQLTTVFQQYGYRLNLALLADGSTVPSAPVPLQRVLAADLPPASEWEGAIIYVSDGAAGTRFRGSDGTNWVNLG